MTQVSFHKRIPLELQMSKAAKGLLNSSQILKAQV